MRFAAAICILAGSTVWADNDRQGEVPYRVFAGDAPEVVVGEMVTADIVESGNDSRGGVGELGGVERCSGYEQSCPLEGVVRCLRACLSINNLNSERTMTNILDTRVTKGEGSCDKVYTRCADAPEPKSGNGSGEEVGAVVFAGGAFVRNGGLKFNTSSVALGEFVSEAGGVTPPGNGDFFILHREGSQRMIDSNDVNFGLKNGDFVYAAEKLTRSR
jgi:hypothetical protein